jgi:hypothetical protein
VSYIDPSEAPPQRVMHKSEEEDIAIPRKRFPLQLCSSSLTARQIRHRVQGRDLSRGHMRSLVRILSVMTSSSTLTIYILTVDVTESAIPTFQAPPRLSPTPFDRLMELDCWSRPALTVMTRRSFNNHECLENAGVDDGRAVIDLTNDSD